jgi:hypothetical protein
MTGQPFPLRAMQASLVTIETPGECHTRLDLSR